MRLLDQVALADNPVVLRRPSGSIVQLPGAGSMASDLASTTQRYVLDRAATSQCWRFALENEGMFDPENQLLRLPAESLWAEWFADVQWSTRGAEPLAQHRRAGILAKAAKSGRAGTLYSFWENPQGEPDLAQAAIDFDLDAPLHHLADGRMAFKVSADRPGPIAELLRHVVLRLDEGWADVLASAGKVPFRRAVDAISQAIWANLVMALGLSALLESRGRVSHHVVDRTHLNAARRKQGKAALLDHTEVILRLEDRSSPSVVASDRNAARQPARLHCVRGHMVRRGTKVFWRIPHLRGKGGPASLFRTVSVRGALTT